MPALTDNEIHDQANRDYYATMPTRRVTIRVEVEADVEWREDDPDYCEQVARLETAWGDGARCNNRTARVLSVVVEHPVDEYVPVGEVVRPAMAPEPRCTHRWFSHDCRDHHACSYDDEQHGGPHLCRCGHLDPKETEQ